METPPEGTGRRPGLAPVPRRVPPLPGGGQPPRPVEPPAPPASGPYTHTAVADHELAAAGDADAPPRPKRYRPTECQLDPGHLRDLDTLVFAIRLRTGAMDRSALVRGILGAVLASGADILAHCRNEADVVRYLSQLLPPRTP